MKKMLYVGMLAIAVSCLLASCAAANEEKAEMPMNEKKEVTLTTSLDLASRASMVDKNLELFYTVYNAGNGAIVEKNTAGLQSVSFEGKASFTQTLQLEESKTYDIAFGAQPKGQTCYDLSDMKAIKLRYEECHSNDNICKAFYGSVFGLHIKDQTTATVYLKSPFSTLEVFTSDHLLTKDHETVEVEVTLSHPEIEKQPLVFTAGRAWLRQNPDHHLG